MNPFTRDALPTGKVAAGGVTGALVFLVISTAARFGLEITAEEGVAATVILSFLASYIKA